MLFETSRRRLLAGLALGAAGMARAAPADDIVVGQIGPWTVLPVPDVPQLNQGIKAHLAQVNAHGGINGRKISLFELDDAYSPDTFVKRFHEAMLRKPVALLSPLGGASLQRMLDAKLLDSADVVVLNAVPGAETLRKPGHPKLFHLRAGDSEQIEKMVTHADTLGMSRVGVMYETVPIGESALQTTRSVMSHMGTMQIRDAGSSRDPAQLAAAAKRVADFDVHCVLVLGTPRFAVDAIAALRQAGVAKMMFTFSYVPAALVTKVVGDEAARGVGIAQTFPNPTGVNTPLQREFRAAMQQAYPQLATTAYTPFHLEGYVTARVLTEALKRAPQATPDALAKALRTMGEIDIGGYRLNFSRGNTGSSFVDIGVVTNGGRLMY